MINNGGLVRAIIHDAIGDLVPHGMIGELAAVFDRRCAVSLPGPHDTAAIAIESPKTAALIYDRVWFGSGEPPPDISFCGATPQELAFYVLTILGAAYAVSDPEIGKLVYERTAKTVDERYPELKWNEQTWQILSRTVSDGLATTHGLHAVPVYNSIGQFEREYKPGSRAVVITFMERVEIVSEEALTWEQVKQVRADNKSRLDLMRLTHWLDKEMLGKTESFVHDELALRLDNYDKAIRKHGLATKLGSLSGILDPQFIAAAAGLSALVTYSADAFWGYLAGTGLAVGKVAVSIAQAFLDNQKPIESEEVAFIASVRGLKSQ